MSKIQSCYLGFKSRKKYKELKRIKPQIESLSNSSNESISNHPVDLEECNDVQNENSRLNQKLSRYEKYLDITLSSSLHSSYSNISNINLAPANEMKGYFLLKKKKYTHEGNTKSFTQTDTSSKVNENNSHSNNNIIPENNITNNNQNDNTNNNNNDNKNDNNNNNINNNDNNNNNNNTNNNNNNTNNNNNNNNNNKQKSNRNLNLSIKPTIIKEGFGIITWEDKSQLFSIFQNNKANGISKYIDPENNIIFVGEYFHNKPRGFGYYKNPKGTTFEGYWKNNILNGIGIEIWKDSTFYQGEFKNNKRNGIGLYRWSDGTIYHGEWVNDEMTGYCLITYRDEKMYIGEIDKGIMNGYGEFTWKNGKKYLGYYKNDFKEGFGIYIFEHKPFQAYVGFWSEGKMDGLGLVIKGRNIKYGFWKKGERKQRFKGPWEFKIFNKRGSAMFKNNFCINDDTSVNNTKTISVIPTITVISENGKNKENDGYIKFMSKDVDFIREFIEKLL